MLPPGKAVQVRTITCDRYERSVAELYGSGQSINLQMVKDGQTVVYRQYLNGCSATKDQYLQAEAQLKTTAGLLEPEVACHALELSAREA